MVGSLWGDSPGADDPERGNCRLCTRKWMAHSTGTGLREGYYGHREVEEVKVVGFAGLSVIWRRFGVGLGPIRLLRGPGPNPGRFSAEVRVTRVRCLAGSSIGVAGLGCWMIKRAANFVSFWGFIYLFLYSSLYILL